MKVFLYLNKNINLFQHNTGSNMSDNTERKSYADLRSDNGKNYSQIKNPFAAEAERAVGESLGTLLDTAEEWNSNDSLMASRLFIDGLWLNKADEIASWIAAAAVKVLRAPGSDKPLSEIRQEMLTTLQAEQDQFYEERPAAALSANISGGLLSPVGLKGGQLLSRARDVRNSALALRASDEITNTLSSVGRITPSAIRPLQTTTAAGTAAGTATVAGLQATGQGATAATRGGASLAQQLSGFSPRTYNVLGKTPFPVLAAGAAAVEGGIIGAEGDTLEEITKNAATSAVLGAGFSTLLSGAGMAVNAALKTNTAQELGKGADFVSLMFTDNFAAPVYRHVISKAFGASSFMEEQARLVSARLPNISDLKQRGVNLVQNSAIRVGMAKEVIKAEGDAALTTAKKMADDLTAELTANGKIKLEDLDDVSKQRIAVLRGKTGETVEQIQAAVAREAEISTNTVEASFRTKAFQSSFPVGTPKHIINNIQAMTPREALVSVREAWETFGYRAAKNAKIPVNRESLSKEIESLIKNAPEYALLESPGVPGGLASRMATYVDNMLSKELNGDISGTVSGQVMVKVRSDLGKAINGLAQNNPSARSIVKPIQQHIDDIISKNLSKKAANEFAAESDLWRIKSHLEDAAEKAISKEGAFSGEDWVKAASKQSKRTATIGEGVLQKEAEMSVSLRNASNKTIEDTRDNTIKRVNKETNRLIEDEKARIKSEKRVITQEYQQQIREAKNKFNASSKGIKETTEFRINRVNAKDRWETQLKDIDGQIAKLEEAQKKLKRLLPKGDNTIFEKMFATSLLAGVFGLGGAAVGGFSTGPIIAAIGLAGGLSTQPAQRLLAGQTQLQKTGASIADKINEVFNRTEAKFGVSPTRAAALAAAQPTREGVMFNDEVKASIRKLPNKRKADIFRSIEMSGKLEIFKAQDPAFYKELANAAR
jgi:hypothetical protein